MAVNFETLKQKLAQAKKELVRNEKPVKPSMGATDIVLLPGWNPERREIFWREFGGHYIKQGNKVVAFYPCDDVIYNQPCPVCQKLAEAARLATDDATMQAIREARSGHEYLVNAIVLNTENKNPVVFSLSKTAFEQLIDTISAWSEAVFDEKNPMVVRINRSGTGFDTRYTVTCINQHYPLDPSVMSKLIDLDKYVDQKTESALQKSVAAIASLTGANMLSAPAQMQAPALPTADTFDSPEAGVAVSYVAPQPVQPVAQPVAPQPPIAAQPIQTQAYVAPQPAPAQPVAQAAPQAAPVQIDSDMEELLKQLNL